MYTDRTVKNTMMLNVKKASHGLTISWYGSYASSKVVAPNQPAHATTPTLAPLT